MFTNRYIFIYSVVMVVVVAAVLSSAAMILKPFQDKNIAIAKMQGILASIEIEAEAEKTIELFDQYITEERVIDPSGNIQGVYKGGKFEKGEVRAFDINLKKELYKKSKNNPFLVPMYVAKKDGKEIYIIPLLGKGLWGPVYGNIALGADLNTVIGADFGHDKETPGLGAEIANRGFAEQFIGKTLFDDKGNFVSIKVIKGGASTLPTSMQIHGVDAISGGTITCNSVTDMLVDCLENYVPYIKKEI